MSKTARRDVVRMALAFVAVLIGHPIRGRRWSGHPGAAPFEALRRAYLASGGCPAAARAHLAQVLEEGADGPGAGVSGLGSRRTEDFARGRTRLLDGWVLSESEVRCAVAVSLEAEAAA